MDPIAVAVPDEIALEGLDGITLNALWFRLSERLKLALPLNQNFQNVIWKLIINKKCYTFFEIREARATPGRLDRLDFLFNKDIPDEVISEQVKSSYYIYKYAPVEDAHVRGSCEEFKTRKSISLEDVRRMSLDDVAKKYGNKFVIVASQSMRTSVLVPKNAGCEIEMSNIVYCILERIGRARFFGEATSGRFSLIDFIKDSKLLHYNRNLLLKYQLVHRQQIQQRIRSGSQTVARALLHLPRFFVMVRPSNMLLTEKLFCFLKEKPLHAAELDEVKQYLNITQKSFVQFVKSRSDVFIYNTKALYRELRPDATKEEYLNKNKTEKTISCVKLVDPNFDVFKLWVQDTDDVEGDDEGFLDCSNQIINQPLTIQIYKKIEQAGREGMTQAEVGKHFGLGRLNARAIMRKVQRERGATFYMKDEGRQRVSRYVTREFAEESSNNLIAELAELTRKANEAAERQVPLPMCVPKMEVALDADATQKNQDDSSTRVSIKFSPGDFKFLEPEPVEKSIIQIMPSEQPSLPSRHEDVSEIVDSKLEIVNPEKYQDSVSIVVPVADSSFIDNVENVSVSMKYLNSIPGMKKQCKGLAIEIAQRKISQKVLTRMNAILDIIREKTVIDSLNLFHIMRQQEADAELAEEICRKSLVTLCGRLAADNFIKVVEIELKSESKTVRLVFFAEPNVSFDMRCWHSIIEEQKIQHFVPFNRSSTAENMLLSESILKPSMSDMSTGSKMPINSEDLTAQSIKYDHFPKFMKMRLFHEFLFYLVYGYPKEHTKISVHQAIEAWKKSNCKVSDFSDITDKITNVYTTEINWKMFVPPLNPQRDYENGWALMRDIIHRIPLILYIKFVRLGFEIPGLSEYLNHPIKCNFLIHFLPARMRMQLLHGRKYVFAVQELCRRLCYCGLLQFGPMRTKVVDQTLIYLNRNASLLDTTSSADGYYEISDRKYPRLIFLFDNHEVISDYWSSMFQIATNTRINKKSTAIGKEIIFESMHSKEALQKSLKIQSSTTAPLNDKGDIPGDGKGAAGLDKSMLSHLKQNWSQTMIKDKKIRRRLSPAMPRNVRLRRGRIKKEKLLKPKKELKSKYNETTRIKQVNALPAPKFKATSTTSSITGLNPKSKIIRKSAPIKKPLMYAKKDSCGYDAVDREALKKLKAQRVIWSDVEDKLLLLCKVALRFIFNFEAQVSHYFNGVVVRDILYWRTEKSHTKTTKSCQRRLAYLMKTKPSFKEQVALYLEELKSHSEFVMKYKNLLVRLKSIYPMDEVGNAIKIHVIEMVHQMHQILFKQFPSSNERSLEYDPILLLPDDYNVVRKQYILVNPNDSLVEKRYEEPRTINEVEVNLLMAMIHSAVCCVQDRTSYTVQLFEVYKKFSETSLSMAVTQLRRAYVISVNKKEKIKEKNVLPYAYSPFHLSNRYSAQMEAIHVNISLHEEFLRSVKTLSDCNNSYQMDRINCGWVYMLAELTNIGIIQLRCDKTERQFTLDATKFKKSGFEKVSDRYMGMMATKKQKKDKIQFHSDSRSSDEKFAYCDDPIEVFCKMDQHFLHVFCLLNALENRENIKIENWKISETGVCGLENCVNQINVENFSDEIQRIANDTCDLVNDILSSEKEGDGPSREEQTVIVRGNFLKFLDSIIKKRMETRADADKKIFSTKSRRIYRKITGKSLLVAVRRLAIEQCQEDGSWLCDYKKISGISDDVDDLNDDDLNATGNDSNNLSISQQMKEMNANARTNDLFIVNLSAISVDIKAEPKVLDTLDGIDFNAKLMPFSDDDRAKFFEKIIKDCLWKPHHLTNKLQDILQTIDASDADKQQMIDIYKFLDGKKMGVRSCELLTLVPDKHNLQRNIETLMNHKFVIRTGVNDVIFVSKEYATIWLIETYHLSRDEREAIIKATAEKNSNNDETPLKKPKLNADCSAGNNQQEIDKQQVEADQHLFQQSLVRLRPCPWIRVNGSLNRRCIDKWLGTILAYLTLNPGLWLKDLMNKFNVITPFDVRCLMEILQSIGCIQMLALAQSKVDLFSASCTAQTIEPATYFDDPNQIFIEINTDAMQRLTFFIGRKKYKNEFV